MVHVRFVSRELNPERTAYVDIVRAELRVDGQSVEVDDQGRWIDFDIPVLDLETGHTLRFSDDPEAWARNLGQAYRMGDFFAVVEVEAGVGVEAGEAAQSAGV